MSIPSLFELAVPFVDRFGQALFAWGWVFVVFFTLWLVWETYKFLKMIDYVSAIQWTYLQIKLPDNAEQTPKAFESAIDVWAGIHKDPDLIEKFFEGYLEAWFSCELQCRQGQARYIMVVPTVHRQFFEGVIYGQYPTAEVKEVEDYSLEYRWQDIGKKFDIYGTEMVLVSDDFYPIRTYREYEDSLAPEDRFIDPHQSLVEMYTNVRENDHYWVQVLIRPVDASVIEEWAKKGEQEVKEISGQATEEPKGIWAGVREFFLSLPGEMLKALTIGPTETKAKTAAELRQLRFFNPVDEAKMKGILQKISRGAHRTKIRVIHIAPAGELHKPNIGRAIGGFKQFNTMHLNSLKPDPETKTNGPNYILKFTRRRFRERSILVNFQWRDFFGTNSGYMMSSEELATVYHFPGQLVRAPVLERSKAGLASAPENLPYV